MWMGEGWGTLREVDVWNETDIEISTSAWVDLALFKIVMLKKPNNIAHKNLTIDGTLNGGPQKDII